MAKQINTRIQLKHDTLAAWNSSDIQLKYGEAAVAFIDTATTDAHGNIIHVPTALLKFGDSTGTKTFKELPFASALAADVYNWAKAYTVILNGKTLEFQKSDGTAIHSVALNFLTQADAEALLVNYYNKTEIDDKIDAINTTIADLDVSALESRVDTLEAKVDVEKVSDAIKSAISELDAAYKAADELKADKTQVATDIANAIAPLATSEALNTVASNLAEHEEAFADYQETVTAALNDKVNQTALANYYTKEEADTEFATPAEVIEAVNKAIDDVANVDSITNITTLVEYANQNAGTIGALIEEVYGNSTITDTSRIDTAIADSAQAKTDAATAVSTANSASTVAGEAKTAAEGAVATANEAKEAAITAQDSASASATAAAGSASDANSAKEAAVTAQGAAEAARDEAVEAKEAAEASNTSATAIANEAKSTADAAKTASETATANVATLTEKVNSLTTDDIDGGTEVWVFNCGTSTTVI